MSIEKKVKETAAMIEAQRSCLVAGLSLEVSLFRKQYDSWGQVLGLLGEPYESADDIVARVCSVADNLERVQAAKSGPKTEDEPQAAPGPSESKVEQGGDGYSAESVHEARRNWDAGHDPRPPTALRGKALVLDIMRGESERSWTLEEIRKRAGCTASAVAQTLAGLKKEGAVVSPEGRAPGRGGALYYRLTEGKKVVPPRPRLPTTPHQEVDEGEIAVVVDTVNELPGRWLTADGVFERMHNPEAWHGGHQARRQIVLRIASALEAASGKEQIERSMDDDGRPTYRALGTKAPKEGRTPLQQGTRAKKKG